LDAQVTWHGRLSFTGSADSGFSLPLGTSRALGGDEDGFRPMELIATGLAGCTAMDVISIMTKKHEVVTAFEVQVHARQAHDHPKVFTQALIEYFVTGHAVSEEALRRSIELSTSTYCPAQAMLSQVMGIELKYHIFEDEGDGKRSLVKSGIYIPLPSQVKE
jgi:putative redox protein